SANRGSRGSRARLASHVKASASAAPAAKVLLMRHVATAKAPKAGAHPTPVVDADVAADDAAVVAARKAWAVRWVAARAKAKYARTRRTKRRPVRGSGTETRPGRNSRGAKSPRAPRDPTSRT